MSAPVTRRAVLGAATATVGAMGFPIAVETGFPASLPTHPDARLFALLDRYPAVQAAADAAEAVSDRLWAAYCEQEPPRPEALFWRPDDRLGSAVREMLPDGRWAPLYDNVAVDRLRRSPEPTRRGAETREPLPGDPDSWIARTERVPDERRIARRAEILAAHDRWRAECEAVRGRLGIPAADAAELAAVERLDELAATILSTRPRTMRGLGAKARWASRSELSEPTRAIWFARIVADVAALAEGEEAAAEPGSTSRVVAPSSDSRDARSPR